MGSIFFQPCDSFLVWVTILVALAAGYNSISRHDLVKKIDPRRSGTAVMTCFKHLCGNIITLRKYIFLLSGLAIPRDKKAVLTVCYLHKGGIVIKIIIILFWCEKLHLTASKLKFHRLCLCYLQSLCLYAFEHFLIYRCGGRHISLDFRHNEFIHLKLVYYLAHFTNMVSVRVGGN